jgi:glyoxylase-like metal-dependent hydrolase (beta-lactamase superfamily II)
LNVVSLHAANPGIMTGAGNWTYLIPGSSPVLFDAGVGHDVHLDAIASAVPAGPGRVVVSHAHSDHVSGAAAVAARWPAATFSKLPWPEKDDPSIAWRWMADALSSTPVGPTAGPAHLDMRPTTSRSGTRTPARCSART